MALDHVNGDLSLGSLSLCIYLHEILPERFLEFSNNRTKKARQCLAENSSGAATRLRTRDLLITSQLLYQLSYSGIKCRGYSIDFSGFGLVSIFEKFFSTNWPMQLVGALPFCRGELGASTLSD